jgi:hypothetical protein
VVRRGNTSNLITNCQDGLEDHQGKRPWPLVPPLQRTGDRLPVPPRGGDLCRILALAAKGAILTIPETLLATADEVIQ